MIERVRGRLLAAAEDRIVVEVGGIALRLEVTIRLARRLAAISSAGSDPAEVTLFTHLVLRPDQWQLFGFEDEEARRLFRTLLGIPGVGPRMAIALLSHLSIEAIQEAVDSGDPVRLEAVPGIGKRIAGRIAHELSGKIRLVAGASPALVEAGAPADAADALIALGLSPQEAGHRVRAAVEQLGADADSAALISAALQQR